MNTFLEQEFEVLDSHKTAYYMVGSQYQFIALLTSCGYSTLIMTHVIYLN